MGIFTDCLNKLMPLCPECGRRRYWYSNRYPRTAYCWGTKKKPHNEVKLPVPRKHWVRANGKRHLKRLR
jgi:hypothetical protein